MRKNTKKPIAQVTINADKGRVPVGIMNAEQALKLPDCPEKEFSHPDHEAGATDIFVRRVELGFIARR